MNEDLFLKNELQAVKELVLKTRAEVIRRERTATTEPITFPSDELLRILEKEGDTARIYFLDKGPLENALGVYRLNEDGRINPDRLYGPMEYDGSMFGPHRMRVDS